MSATPRLQVRYGCATSSGRQRAHNEDAYLAEPPVFLVADGMGGHARGEVASQAVVDAFRPLGTGEWVTAAQLAMAVSRAQRAVAALRDGSGAEPGSTLAGVALSEQSGRPCWLVFNIGDSRTYRLRSGDLEQVSVDHSQVQALIDDAGYSAARARRTAPRNVITRAIGAGLAEPLPADEWLLIAATGDRIMICTDGLTSELTDHLIAATLLSAPEPAVAAQALVDAAVTAGGRDNVTVIVLDAVAVEGPGVLPGDDVDTLSTCPEGVGPASDGEMSTTEIDTIPSLGPAAGLPDPVGAVAPDPVAPLAARAAPIAEPGSPPAEAVAVPGTRRRAPRWWSRTEGRTR